MKTAYDLIVVGGGLSGCLLAHRLSLINKAKAILIIEKEASLGGQHTWSFHETDIPEESKEWFLPLASKVWEGHQVQFPALRRQLKGRYGSIKSKDFDLKIRSNAQIHFRLKASVARLQRDSVTLKDGTVLTSKAVVDARGFEPIDVGSNAYQKFVGLHIKCSLPHGVETPVLMDATVSQIDGYRFMYLLPWSETEILLEDTYYSESPKLEKDIIKERIFEYASSRGWQIDSVLEEEEGVLPIPLFENFLKGEKTVAESLQNTNVPRLGVSIGLFNRTTGFSLPVVLNAIEKISRLEKITSESIFERLKALLLELEGQHKKFCFLNRMLFWGTPPEKRYTILEKFYVLPERLIAKFYSVQMSSVDWARFFFRKPPISVRLALQSGFKKRVLSHA